MTKQEQKDAALKAYEAIKIPAWEAYRAIEGPAQKAYKAIKKPALKAYRAELERIDNEPDEPDEDIIELNGKRYQLIK